MTGEELILQFHKWHGGPLTIAELKAYRAEVQRYVESIGNGPYVPRLKEIQTRVVGAIKKWAKQGITEVECVDIAPIKVEEPKKVEPVKVKEKVLGAVPKKEKRKAFKPKSRGKKKVAKVESIKLKVKSKSVKKKISKKRIESVDVAKSPVRLAPLHPKEGKAESTAQEQKPVTNISGVSYDYKEIDLGKYQNDFHRMFSDTIVQIHGMPGHGKTVWLLKYAQYRAEQGEHVLYVAREEFGRSVFDIKLKENNIGHANLRFKRELIPEDMAWATVIFLDSCSALKLDHEDIEDLSIEYPNRNWYIVLQATKEGEFRGSNEWEHLVDVAGEIRNRILILNKNRLDKDNAEKREKLLTEQLIKEKTKDAEIKKAVKAGIDNNQPNQVIDKSTDQPITKAA